MILGGTLVRDDGAALPGSSGAPVLSRRSSGTATAPRSQQACPSPISAATADVLERLREVERKESETTRSMTTVLIAGPAVSRLWQHRARSAWPVSWRKTSSTAAPQTRACHRAWCVASSLAWALSPLRPPAPAPPCCRLASHPQRCLQLRLQGGPKSKKLAAMGKAKLNERMK